MMRVVCVCVCARVRVCARVLVDLFAYGDVVCARVMRVRVRVRACG